jgi:hypothetical protein
VWNLDNLAVAAGHSVDAVRWRARLDELMSRIAVGSPGWNHGDMRVIWCGLLSDLQVKNCWTLSVRHEVAWGEWELAGRGLADVEGVAPGPVRRDCPRLGVRRG